MIFTSNPPRAEHIHLDPATDTTSPMDDDAQRAAARARSERLMRSHQDYVNEAREFAPTWLAISDDTNETLWSPEACELLADTAPHEYWTAFWLGRAVALREIQLMTGRTSN
jgi:hypothetical protein